MFSAQGESAQSTYGRYRIAESKAIIIANTIAEAFKRYEAHQNPAAVLAVIIGESAPSTSHYANTLLAEGKVVLHVDNVAAVKQVLSVPIDSCY